FRTSPSTSAPMLVPPLFSYQTSSPVLRPGTLPMKIVSSSVSTTSCSFVVERVHYIQRDRRADARRALRRAAVGNRRRIGIALRVEAQLTVGVDRDAV